MVVWRRAWQPRRLKQTSDDTLDVLGALGGTPTAAILVAGARAVRGTGTFRNSETGGNLPRRLDSSYCRRNLPSFCAYARCFAARSRPRRCRQRRAPVSPPRNVSRAGTTARYDDRNEGQLGDVLFEDNRTVIAVFGSKCDRGGAGKPVALPAASEPGSGANLLADSVRRAMTRRPQPPLTRW